MRSVEQRFWEKVDRSGACWEWTGSRNSDGYGNFRSGGSSLKAHRWVFELAHGYLPKVVRHRCDNPGCVRPSHLMGGTQADNVADMYARGRQNHPGHRKLSAKDVGEIRSRLAAGETHTSISKDYVVNRQSISNIATGHTWNKT